MAAAANDCARGIFLEALDKASLVERAAFVAQACGGDGELRLRIDALLRAHETPFDLLDNPAVERLVVSGSNSDRPPAAIVRGADQAKLSDFGVARVGRRQDDRRGRRRVARSSRTDGVQRRQRAVRNGRARRSLRTHVEANMKE